MARLTPVSWGSTGDPNTDHLINDGLNYQAEFRTRTGGAYVHSPRPVDSIKTERPGKSPIHALAQPRVRPLFLWVRLLPNTATVETPGDSDVTLALVDQLQSWFSETNGQQWLVAEDQNGELRRIRAIRTLMAPDQDWVRWNIELESDYGLWESVEPQGTDYEGVVVSEAEPTFQIQGRGSMPAYPTITMTPLSVKAAVESPRYRRRVISVNRVPRPVDTPSIGWPVDLTGGGLDLEALQTAGKLLSNFDDLRVIIAGQERDRWLSTALPAASTMVWTNLSWRSGRSVILATSIDADDTVIRVSDFNGFGGWEPKGALLIDNEVMLYERDPLDLYEVEVVRGAFGTTPASHVSTSVGRWVEHPYADIFYGFSNAGTAPAPLSRKPVIDLALSNNNSWYWTGPYFNQEDLRTGTFLRSYTNDNPGSPFLRCYETNGEVRIENRLPEAGKPRANNFFIDIPVGLSLVEAAILTGVRGAVGKVDVEQMVWTKIRHRTSYAFQRVADPVHQITYGMGSTYTWYTYSILDDGSSETETRTPVSSEGLSKVSLSHQKFYVGEQVEVIPSEHHAGGETIRTTPQYERVVKTETETTYERERGIRSEHRQALTDKVYITDREAYESWLLGNNFNALPVNRDVFRVRFNAEIVIGVDEDGEPWDTIPDSARDSGAYFYWKNIRMNFNQNNTPRFIIGAEEEVYLVDGRLLNETTGEYIDILFPLAIGQSLIIDTKDHLILDPQTGWEVPFAMRGGSWPTIREGVVNTWRWIEADTSELQIDFEWRTEWN